MKTAELKSTLPTAENRSFNTETDFGVIRQGENATAMTMFGGLDVIQRAQGVPSYSQLAEDAVESELLGIPVRPCGRLRKPLEGPAKADR
jgi:hypothetical protein